MKRILTIILILSFVQSFGQKTQQSLGTKNTMVTVQGDLKVDSLLFLPENDTLRTPHKLGAVVLKQSDSTVYYWAAYWRPLGGNFVRTVFKRNDSLFYQKGGTEYFVAKWGIRAFTVPTGLTATQIGDSIAVTTALNGLIIGNGTGFSTAAVSSPLYYENGTLRMAQAGIDSSGYLSSADWQSFNSKIASSRQVATSGSLTGGGALTQDRTLTLINDHAAPGNWKYYGTNGAGVKGFFDVPSSIDSVLSVFGRTQHVIADSADYQSYYSGKSHVHAGLLPPGGRLGEVLRKRSDNDYDAVWQTGGGGSDKYITGFTISGTTYKTIVGYYSDGTTTAPSTWFDNTTDSNSTANIDTVNLSNRINAKQAYGDTLTYDATKFWVQQQNYLKNITGKIQQGTNITITGNGDDVPYTINASGIDTTSLSNRINGKQNISDTSVWDATRYWVEGRGYITGEDTVSLSNRINLKLNASDTASLSNRVNYAYNGVSLLNDTTFVFNRPNGIKDTIIFSGLGGSGGGATVDTTSLSNRINGKQDISDTSTVDATRYWSGTQYAVLGHNHDAVYVNMNDSTRFILNRSSSFAQSANFNISGSGYVGTRLHVGIVDASLNSYKFFVQGASYLRGNTSIEGGVYAQSYTALGNNSTRVTSPSGNYTILGTSTNNNLMVLNGDNVSIGRDNYGPAYKLDVYGTGRFTSVLRADSTLILGNESTAPTGSNGAKYYNSTTHKEQTYVNGAWQNVRTENNNTFDMIGGYNLLLNASAGAVDVRANADAYYITNTSANASSFIFRVGASPVEKARINSAGDLITTNTVQAPFLVAQPRSSGTGATNGFIYYDSTAGVKRFIGKVDGVLKKFLMEGDVTGGGSGTVNNGTANRLAYYGATGTAVSELTAITANRALISDANGLPIHSTVTNTELGYLSGTTSSVQSQINALKPDVVTLTGSINLNLTTSYKTINVDASGSTGQANLYLPDATTGGGLGLSGARYVIKKVDNSAIPVVITPYGSQTIEGASSKSLATQYKLIIVYTEGSNWFIEYAN
jgi:hypothetical protein